MEQGGGGDSEMSEISVANDVWGDKVGFEVVRRIRTRKSDSPVIAKH